MLYPGLAEKCVQPDTGDRNRFSMLWLGDRSAGGERILWIESEGHLRIASGDGLVMKDPFLIGVQFPVAGELLEIGGYGFKRMDPRSGKATRCKERKKTCIGPNIQHGGAWWGLPAESLRVTFIHEDFLERLQKPPRNFYLDSRSGDKLDRIRIGQTKLDQKI